jgi:hypothetical protein
MILESDYANLPQGTKVYFNERGLGAAGMDAGLAPYPASFDGKEGTYFSLRYKMPEEGKSTWGLFTRREFEVSMTPCAECDTLLVDDYLCEACRE